MDRTLAALDTKTKLWLASQQGGFRAFKSAIKIDDPNIAKRKELLKADTLQAAAMEPGTLAEAEPSKEERQGWLSKLIRRGRNNPVDTLHRPPAHGNRPWREVHASGAAHPFVNQLPSGRFGQAASSKGGAEYRA